MYYITVVIILIELALFIYIGCFTKNSQYYSTWPIIVLRELLTLSYWALFAPFMELLMGIFKCDNGKNKIVETMNCYEGIHIFYVVFSLIFIILLFGITTISTFFYNETRFSQDDASAKSEDSTEILWILFRLLIIIYTTFVSNVFIP